MKWPVLFRPRRGLTTIEALSDHDHEIFASGHRLSDARSFLSPPPTLREITGARQAENPLGEPRSFVVVLTRRATNLTAALGTGDMGD